MDTSTCERKGCGRSFQKGPKTKRFCSDRCRRIAANHRYRARRMEPAKCKHCGATFNRSATSARKRVYCSPDCQAASRTLACRVGLLQQHENRWVYPGPPDTPSSELRRIQHARGSGRLLQACQAAD